MRRWVVAGVIALALGAVAWWGSGRRPPASEAPSPAEIGPAEKSRIRQFWAVYNEARALQRAGRWQAAADRYRTALALDPRHEDALYNLANCQVELGRFAAALGVLEELVTVNPLSHRGYQQIGVIRSYPHATSVFDLDRAEAAFRRAFAINQEETGSMLRLGELAVVRGDADAALEMLGLANRTNERAREAYYLRGYLQWRAGQPGEAAGLLEQAVEATRGAPHPAAVPGEGDTRSGGHATSTAPATPRLVKPFWNGLEDRRPPAGWDAAALELEFAPLATYLAELRTGP